MEVTDAVKKQSFHSPPPPLPQTPRVVFSSIPCPGLRVRMTEKDEFNLLKRNSEIRQRGRKKKKRI